MRTIPRAAIANPSAGEVAMWGLAAVLLGGVGVFAYTAYRFSKYGFTGPTQPPSPVTSPQVYPPAR